MGYGWYNQSTKYMNKKTEIDGITFDSKKEAKRYRELKLLEKFGDISNLELQKTYILIPAIREEDTIGPKGGIRKGKLIQRAVTYTADFVYEDEDGTVIVEDVKGMKTEVYKLKKKLMLYVHGIDIKEV